MSLPAIRFKDIIIIGFLSSTMRYILQLIEVLFQSYDGISRERWQAMAAAILIMEAGSIKYCAAQSSMNKEGN